MVILLATYIAVLLAALKGGKNRAVPFLQLIGGCVLQRGVLHHTQSRALPRVGSEPRLCM